MSVVISKPQQMGETWTAEHIQLGYCLPGQLGQPIDYTVWHMRDYMEDVCGLQDIGKPRQTVSATPPMQMDVPSVRQLLDGLTRIRWAAMQVIERYPGESVKYFQDHPQDLRMVLGKMVAEPVSRGAPTAPVEVNVNLSWLSPNRLSYKNEDNIVDLNPVMRQDLLDETSLIPLK